MLFLTYAFFKKKKTTYLKKYKNTNAQAYPVC